MSEVSAFLALYSGSCLPLLRSPNDDCVPGLQAPQQAHNETEELFCTKQEEHFHLVVLVRLDPHDPVSLEEGEPALDHPAAAVPTIFRLLMLYMLYTRYTG